MILDLVIFEKNHQVAGNCTVGARGATLVILKPLSRGITTTSPYLGIGQGREICEFI